MKPGACRYIRQKLVEAARPRPRPARWSLPASQWPSAFGLMASPETCRTRPSGRRYVYGIAADIIPYQLEAHVKRTWIAEAPMWRRLIGLLFVFAAIGVCGSPTRPRRRTCTSSLILVAPPSPGRCATQVPGAAAFFYSYIAVLVVALGVNDFFVLPASLAIASALSYSAYHYLVSGSMRQLPDR